MSRQRKNLHFKDEAEFLSYMHKHGAKEEIPLVETKSVDVETPPLPPLDRWLDPTPPPRSAISPTFAYVLRVMMALVFLVLATGFALWGLAFALLWGGWGR